MGNKQASPFDGTNAPSVDVSNGTNHEPRESVSQSLEKHKKTQMEYEYLAKITHFDEETLRLLHVRFSSIDSAIESDGMISVEEFAEVLGVQSNNLLLRRFFNFIDQSDLGQVNFRNFAIAMSMLSGQASALEKKKLSFFLYDMNADGDIDRGELQALVQAALHHISMPLDDEQVELIIDNTFKLVDTNKDGKIDFEEYSDFCDKNPRILQPFVVDVRKLVEYEKEKRRREGFRNAGHSEKRTLTHGPAAASEDNSRLKKVKRSVGKKFGGLNRRKIIDVRSIHKGMDVCAGLDPFSRRNVLAGIEAGGPTLVTRDFKGDKSDAGADKASVLELEMAEMKRIALLLKEHVPIGTRKYRFKTFPNCFVGRDAVRVMIDKRIGDSRNVEQAVQIGQTLMKYKLIEHVRQERPFRNSQYFYVFCF